MRYLQRIAENANVLPLIHEITRRQAQIWKEGETGNIALRRALDGRMRNGPILPFARIMALDLMRSLAGSELGEIWLQRVEQGRKRTVAEPDPEVADDWWNRYLVVLQDQPGCLFSCGDESIQLKVGDVWWYNHQVRHAIQNNSRDDVLHLLVDIRIDE